MIEIIDGEEYRTTKLPSGATVKELVRPKLPEEPQPLRQMSGLAFMDLVGDANMVALLTLAKTDPVCELLVKKLDRADVIDFDDLVRGPMKGMQYLLSIKQLSQEDYDRIMRSEFLILPQ